MTAAPNIASEPTLCAFDPDVIPYQRQVIDLVRDEFDYSKGNLELLLSGAFGSAKSTLLAHLAITHCLIYPGARAAICRRARDDVKRTIWKEVLDHIADDLVEGVDYEVYHGELKIVFSNGSEIVAAYWGDKRYKKFRSWKLSMLVIEEIVENDEDDQEAFKQLKARLRRIPGVTENVLAAATNPDAPTHWVYSYFVEPNLHGVQHPTRYVFYSCTRDNPFIDDVYYDQLQNDLSPREADRYLRGRWIELNQEVIYYAYDAGLQFRRFPYVIDWTLPLWLTFDFNIGHGKPMSAILYQYEPRRQTFHFFSEIIVEGARTADLIEEADARGYLKRPPGGDGKPDPSPVVVWLTGDAAGKHKDTRSSRSDYEIIAAELAARGCKVIYKVPVKNPPIRTRHNRVNAYCKNDKGIVRLFLYRDAVKADKGLRLVKIRKGADYLEDDSKDYQHVTTAIGYGIITTEDNQTSKGQGTVQL